MTWPGALSVAGTFAAVLVALVALWVAIFGPRRVTRPVLSVTVQPEAPDCMLISDAEKAANKNAVNDRYIVRLRVSNFGNEDASIVEVLMIKLWVIDADGRRRPDSSFLPLILRWSWWPEAAISPAWLPKLLPGVFKHCDLLVLSSEQDSKSAARRLSSGEKAAQPNAWMTFQNVYAFPGDDRINPMRKPPGLYQLDFSVAASNAPPIYQTAHITFTGWRDEAAAMFGKDGEFKIKITKTAAGPTTQHSTSL